MNRLTADHLSDAAARLNAPLHGVSELAQLYALPPDVLERADRLSAELAEMQRDLTARAWSLTQFQRTGVGA